jgi:hypothetical protein
MAQLAGFSARFMPAGRGGVANDRLFAGGRFGRANEAAGRKFQMDRLRQMLTVPQVKYGLLALGSGAWMIGVVEHLYSSAATMKYLLMSLLMVVVAIL